MRLYIYVLTAMLILSGCSSSDGSSSNGGATATSAVSGVGVDGYIAGSYVYADLDGSGDENGGDINTTTNAEGNFTFGSTKVAHDTYLYLTGGIDIATNIPFAGTLSASFQGNTTVISPLSTMVASLMQNEGLGYAAAVASVAAMTGLTEEQVVADPFAEPVDTDVFVASQRIVSAATMLGGDFTAAVDALAASDMNITAAAAAMIPPVDPTDALAVDAFILDLQAQMPAVATVDDLVAYQLLIANALNNPGGIPDVADAVAVANALACVTFDAIKGSNLVENNITTDLVLGGCENPDDNVTFAWNSDNTVILGHDGVVIRPDYTGGDVNLTVTVTSDNNISVSADKVFALTIPRLDNHVPVANPDSNSTLEDTPISFNVLANDTDADNDALTVTAVGSGVGFSADGTITYTPALNFNGDFVFDYTVKDSWGDEANGTVTITVTPVNDAPVLDAIADVNLSEDFITHSFVVNATDVDSGSLTYNVESIVPSTILNASFTGNQLDLTSIADQNGDANITVSVTDGDKNDTASFIVHVAAVNDAPQFTFVPSSPLILDETSSDRIIRIDLDIIDIDTDLSLISIHDAVVNSGSAGVYSTNDVGHYFEIIVPADSNGETNITITLDDGQNLVSNDYIVQVTPSQSAATITTESISVDIQGGSGQHFALDVQPSDETYTLSIDNGGDINIAIVSISGYDLVVDPQGTGTSTITVMAVNDANASLVSYTDINVTVYDSLNQAPTASASVITVQVDSAIDANLSISDPDGDAMTIVMVTPPAHGSIISHDGYGHINYLATGSYIGDDSFTYKAYDDQNYSNAATVTVHVTAAPYSDSGSLTEKPITLEEFNSYPGTTNYGVPMYSVWEDGWASESKLTVESITINESPQELYIFHYDTNATDVLPYTLDPDGVSILLDFDQNGTDDLKGKYVGPAYSAELQLELNLTLPDSAVGYKLATLNLHEEYELWSGTEPYTTLGDFMADKTYIPATPGFNDFNIDGYSFKFDENSSLGDGSGTIIRTTHYWDGTDHEIVTVADAGTWEFTQTPGGDDVLIVTPTVYGITTVRIFMVSTNDNYVHQGEYRPANSAYLEYRFDENTMHHLANSIMNVTVNIPEQNLSNPQGEFISFNALATDILASYINVNMYGIRAQDDYGNYIIETDQIRFDSNGSVIITGTGGTEVYPYVVNNDIATLYNGGQPFVDAKMVETITDAATISAMIGIPEGNLGTPVAYRLAHLDLNESVDIWDSNITAIDFITTYSDFATFQTAFMNKQVPLDYTIPGTQYIGYATGTAGVGGTLAEYDLSQNVITAYAGTWEVKTVEGKQIIVYDDSILVNHSDRYPAVAKSDVTGVMSEAHYTPADSGSVELRYDLATSEAIATYLQDQNTSGNPINFGVETWIDRDVEAVPFINDPLYNAHIEVDPLTCDTNVTRSYIWLDGDSSSGNFVISDDPTNYTYTSNDGKVVTISISGGDPVMYGKLSREVNATELSAVTGLFLPPWALGYEVSHADIAGTQGAKELRLDATTVEYLESYLYNNPLAKGVCIPAP